MGAIKNDAPCHWSITDIGYRTSPEDIQGFIKSMLPADRKR
jgi:hypothetical protein